MSTGERTQAREEKRQVLARVDRFANLMDTSIGVPFTRFRLGLEPLIGLIPGVGDAAGLLLSSWLLVEAQRAGAPLSLKARMLANIGIDALGGLLPVVGDLFDAWFKANTRNASLLRRWLYQEIGEDEPSSAPWLLMLAALAMAAIAVVLVWQFGGGEVTAVAP